MYDLHFGLCLGVAGGYSHTWPDEMCHSTRCPFMLKIMQPCFTIDKKNVWQDIAWKEIFRVFLKQWIMHTSGKNVYATAILLRHFSIMWQGSECTEIFHISPSLPCTLIPGPNILCEEAAPHTISCITKKEKRTTILKTSARGPSSLSTLQTDQSWLE